MCYMQNFVLQLGLLSFLPLTDIISLYRKDHKKVKTSCLIRLSTEVGILAKAIQ
jgi:hypothetical protein